MKARYGKAKEAWLGGDLDWDADSFVAIAIDTALYTVDIDVDEFLSDIPLAARVATSPPLTGKTKTLGVADAANTVFSAVTGATIEGFVIVQDTGVEGTSRLVLYDDDVADVTPNGGDINLNWDDGVNRIFSTY